jgi:SAM-dependent methyltransferase
MRFETRYTYDFTKRFLPQRRCRILEIGCGSGELAAALSQDGHDVIAIDRDPESVTAARQLGVNARIATWPGFDNGNFDAILFTRSLHHIHPLDESVRRAADSLTDSGCVIVEDFAYEAADDKTLRWFASAIRSLQAAGSLAGDDEVLKAVLSKTETLKAWRENHESELHTAAEIEARLKKAFGRIIREDVAYYFRYIARAIIATESRDAILQAFTRQEESLSTHGSIVALGRRFVAARARLNLK